MSVPFKVLLDIPQEIYEGLMSGLYVRHRPGVVSIAPGHENAGQIVAWLKELPVAPEKVIQQLPQIQTVALGPFSAMAAISVACTAVICNKLNKMDAKLDALADGQQKIMSALEDLRGFELLNLSTELNQAKEAFLYENYQKTCDRCEDAAGKLKGYIGHHDLVYHMNHRRELDHVFRKLAATITLHVSAAVRVDENKVIPILRINGDYFQQLAKSFDAGVEALRSRIRKFIPTIEEQNAIKTLKTDRELKTAIQKAACLCLAEAETHRTVLEMQKTNQLEEHHYVCLIPQTTDH